MGDIHQANNGVLETTGLADAFLDMRGVVASISRDMETIPPPEDPMVFLIDAPLVMHREPRVPDFTGTRKHALAKDADEVRYVFEDEHDTLLQAICSLPPSCQDALEGSSLVITGNTKSRNITVSVEGIFKQKNPQKERLINLAKAMVEKVINDNDYTCPEMYDRETGRREFSVELVRVVFSARGPQVELLFG